MSLSFVVRRTCYMLSLGFCRQLDTGVRKRSFGLPGRSQETSCRRHASDVGATPRTKQRRPTAIARGRSPAAKRDAEHPHSRLPMLNESIPEPTTIVTNTTAVTARPGPCDDDGQQVSCSRMQPRRRSLNRQSIPGHAQHNATTVVAARPGAPQ